MDESQSAETLTDFGQKVIHFLDGASGRVLPSADQVIFHRALAEANRINLMELRSALGDASGSGRLASVGLAGAQLEMRVAFALRSIERAGGSESPVSGQAPEDWGRLALDALGHSRDLLAALVEFSLGAEALVALVKVTEKLVRAA